MSDIDSLRNRVEAAERSFGLIDERERTYSTRLINLIGGIEDQLRRHQSEIAERDARESTLKNENRELRAMLHSLLLAVEDGGRDQLGSAINDMDQRVTALLAGQSAQGASAEGQTAPAGPLDETPDAAATIDAQGQVADAVLEPESDDPEADQSALGDHAPESADNLDLETEVASAKMDEPPVLEAADDGDSEASVPEEIATEPDDASLEDALIDAVAEAIELEPATSTDRDETASAKVDEPPVPEAADDGDSEASAPEEIATEPDDASLEDALIDAVAEAIEVEPATGADKDESLDSSAVDCVDEETADQDELLADLSLADLEPSEPDGMAGDEPAAFEPPAEQPFDTPIEGTDVVMTDGEPPDLADPAPVAAPPDPALAERAEKIAQLLSSGDDSDPSVKEIIEKVTELAETLAPARQETTSEEADLTVESVDDIIGSLTGGGTDPADAEIPEKVTAA